MADKVWIKSGALSFQFIRDGPLGMAAPHWCAFPEHPLVAAQTIFCFHIPDSADRSHVKEDLDRLKPELLVFLRKLRSIDVTMQASNGIVRRGYSLTRKDDLVEGIRRTTLQHIAHVPKSLPTAESFLVFTSTVADMPPEPKRENIHETEILLAFPIDETSNPIVASRDVFNYLPIRSYGLPVSGRMVDTLAMFCS